MILKEQSAAFLNFLRSTPIKQRKENWWGDPRDSISDNIPAAPVTIYVIRKNPTREKSDHWATA